MHALLKKKFAVHNQTSNHASPLVSICIPTYNRLDLLKIALESCFNQTFKNYEIIISDNSENNETKDFIESLCKNNIRYFKNTENIGPEKNVALSISLGVGKYIKPLMDDDVLMPTALEEMVGIMESQKSVGVVMAPLKIINFDGKQIAQRAYLIKKRRLLYRYKKSSQLLPKKLVLIDFMTKQYPCCVPSGLMYRNEGIKHLGSIDVEMKFIGDVEICARFATTYDFYYIDKPLSSWRYSELSYTVVNLHQQGESTEIYYRLTEKLLANPSLRNIFSEKEFSKIQKKAYFFSTKRAMISVIAGIRTKNISLVLQTFKIIKKNDPYKSNLVLLPFNLAGEMMIAAMSWFR